MKRAWMALMMCAALGAGAAYGTPPYLSGGVGDESLMQMKSERAEYNVHLTFAEQGTGAWLYGAHVKVVDHAGMVVLDAKANGPLFYAQLAPGRYTVTAQYEGMQQEVVLTLGRSGQQDHVFRFAGER
ncbi:carboxypeptidase-like regulatory domain-containing protein [Chitinibacteraceae bacterium HSL-7]